MRLTRNVAVDSTSIPGNSWPRWAAITCSSGTNRSPSGITTNRGSRSGTLTRANRRSPVTGSRRSTARFSERFEMYGNGWPGSTASGVSTGKIRCSNVSTRNFSSSSSRSSHRDSRTPLSARAGHDLVEEQPLLALDQRLDPLAHLDELLAGGAPVGRGHAEPGGHLLLQAGHPHLEELVEVLAEDGEELGPLEERHRLVGRQGQHPLVEVEPGQLPVQVARRVGRRRPAGPRPARPPPRPWRGSYRSDPDPWMAGR